MEGPTESMNSKENTEQLEDGGQTASWISIQHALNTLSSHLIDTLAEHHSRLEAVDLTWRFNHLALRSRFWEIEPDDAAILETWYNGGLEVLLTQRVNQAEEHLLEFTSQLSAEAVDIDVQGLENITDALEQLVRSITKLLDTSLDMAEVLKNRTSKNTSTAFVISESQQGTTVERSAGSTSDTTAAVREASQLHPEARRSSWDESTSSAGRGDHDFPDAGGEAREVAHLGGKINLISGNETYGLDNDTGLAVIADVGDKTYNINTLDAALATLDRLQPVKNAQWDSFDNFQRHRVCDPNTRVEVLHRITEWAKSDSSKGIFWLAGMAGTGKSTIAMSVCQTLQAANWIVASFCFMRGAGDLASAHKVIPTLSYQLSTHDSTFGKTFGNIVTDTIHKRPDIVAEGMGNHMQHLLIEPLQVSARSPGCGSGQIIVIDALDECDDHEMIDALLQLLGTVRTSHHLGLKILLTSRMDWTIRSFFLDAPEIMHQELLLHDFDRATVDRDIEHYLRSELDILAKIHRIKQPWPLESQVKELVELSAGLFIFAAISIRFVRGQGKLVRPVERLAKLCNRDHWKGKSIMTKELDSTYSFIFTNALDGDYEPDEIRHAQTVFHHVLEVLVLTFTSVSTSTISALTGISEAEVANVFEALHAVIGVSDNGHAWILHQSFSEFLRDENRCAKVPQMYIPHQPGHRQLLTYCIRIMEDLLVENICQLESTGSGLDTIAKDSPFSAELQYACLHWHKHFLESGMSSGDWAAAHEFLKAHALKYLEAMAIMHELSQCALLIAELEVWASEQPDLRGMLYDLRRFILSYRTAIEQAPLQVYVLSAHFAPTATIMRSFPNQTAKRCWIKTQPARQWSSRVLRVEIPESTIVQAVLSSDGSRIGLVLEAPYHACLVIETATGGLLELYRQSMRISLSSGPFLSETGSVLGFTTGNQITKVYHTSTAICMFHGEHEHLEGIAPNGSYFVTRYNNAHHGAGVLRVWETATGALRYRIHGAELVVLAMGAKVLVVGPTSYQSSVDLRVYDIESGDVLFASLDPANVIPAPILAGQIGKVELSKCEGILLVVARRSRGPHYTVRDTGLESSSDDRFFYSVVYSLKMSQGVWTPLLGHEEPMYADYVSDQRPFVRDVHIKGKARDAEFIIQSTTRPAGDDLGFQTQGFWNVQTFTQEGEMTSQILGEEKRRGMRDRFPNYRLIGNGHYMCVDSVERESEDGDLKVYDLASKDPVPSSTLHVSGFAFLGYCNMEPLVAITDYTGSEVYDFSGPVEHGYDKERINATALLSPDGTVLATIGTRDILRLWNVQDGTCSHHSMADTLCESLCKESALCSLAIATDNSMVAIMVNPLRSSDTHCWLWDRWSEPELLVRFPKPPRHRGWEIQFSPDGLDIWFRSVGSHADEPVTWQRFSRNEGRLLDPPDNIDGWRMGTHRQTGQVKVDGQWLIRDDGAPDGWPLAWLPNDYRSWDSLWSEPLQTLILHSRTGKVTFIKPNE